jgi:hypothetical protein
MGKYLDILEREERGGYDKNDLNDKSRASDSRAGASDSRARAFGRISRLSRSPEPYYDPALYALERRCPEYVEPERWRQCVLDAQKFLAAWGDKALALGWTADELFGLHEPPAKPHPIYNRLARYDCTGLIWSLQGRRVIALTAATAAIESTSGVVTFRCKRWDKPR